MGKMHIIAKAGLIAIGIYVISIILDGFGPPLLPGWWRPTSCPCFLSWLVDRLDRLPNYLLVLLSLVFTYELLIRTDEWAHRLLHSEDLPVTDDLPLFALTAYRATTVLCGIILIYFAVPTIEPLIRVHLEPEKMLSYELTFPKLIRIILGVYLICGAPYFVSWQVDRTLAYMKQQVNTVQPH